MIINISNKDRKNQLNMLNDCQMNARVNIVFCGECGSVFLHLMNVEDKTICPYCNVEQDLGDLTEIATPI